MKLKLLVFLMFFQVEVHVRAEAELVTEFFSMAAGSHCQKVDETTCQLESGAVRMNKGDLIVKTPYASAQSSGVVWVMDEGSKILVQVKSGEANLILKDGVKISLKSGSQIWVSGLSENGRASVGVTEKIDLKKYIRNEKSVSKIPVEEFKKELKASREAWETQEAERLTASVIFEKSSMKVQELDQSSHSKVEKAQKIMDERAEYRKLYYKKVFEQ